MSGGIRTPGVEAMHAAGDDRIQAPVVLAEDEFDQSLRPRRLSEFVGQPRVKEQLEIFIEAARGRGEALDHVLLAGASGESAEELIEGALRARAAAA